MATNLSGSIRAQVSMKYNSGNLALTNDQYQMIEAFSMNLTNGTGAGQADLILANNVPALGTSASTTFDLDAGTLTAPDGSALTFVKVKAVVLFHAGSSSASSIKLGGDFVTTHSMSEQNFVAGGGTCIFDPTGYTVTATTGDVLTVTNNDGSNTANYDIFIIGTSA